MRVAGQPFVPVRQGGYELGDSAEQEAGREPRPERPAPPAERPSAFVRGIDIVDGKNGGFLSPSCTPGRRPAQGFCYDTRIPGNGNGGHTFGTSLTASEKEDLIAYLLTF